MYTAKFIFWLGEIIKNYVNGKVEMNIKLNKHFYTRKDVTVVAEDLLGRYIWTNFDNKLSQIELGSHFEVYECLYNL